MLSLNSVARGYCLPSAAAGFGFEDVGGRPVVDAKIVRGFRPGVKLVSIKFIRTVQTSSLMYNCGRAIPPAC